MNIEQIFEKRLDRNINGVVKAEQTDDASAWIELDEYVITRELEGHLRHFFESYVPATGPERIRMENKIGVWVSGFFGSGKSHFIKILSYLLSNRKVSHNGTERNAYSFFEDKIKDALFLADINKAVHHPTEVILFNIDSRANVDDKEDAILKVFLKVFNERLATALIFRTSPIWSVNWLNADNTKRLKLHSPLSLSQVGKKSAIPTISSAMKWQKP